jgi:hypothetical protein
MERPAGITVLAILHFLGGIFNLAISCFTMAAGRWLTSEAEDTGDVPPMLAPVVALRGNFTFWLGLFGAGASLFRLVAGAGLWTLQPWGWRLALISAALKLAAHLLAAFRGAVTPGRVVDSLVDVAVLVYLSLPHVRHALVPVESDTAKVSR